MRHPTLGELFAQALRRNHDAVAIIDGERSYSYRAVAEYVGSLLTLFDRNGYRRGHRVGLALPMGFEFLSWYIATQIGGLACCDLPPAMSADLLRSRITAGGLNTIIVKPEAFGSQFAVLTTSLDAEVIVTSPAGGYAVIDDLLTDASPQPIRYRPTADFAFIAFTGGSTGAPKAEGFSGESSAALALTIMAAVPFPAAPVTVAYRTGSLVMQLGVNQTFFRGGTVVTLPDFDLAAINTAARRYRANNFFLATRTISTLADQDDIDWMRGQVQLIFHGGEPLAPASLRKAIDRLGQIFVASYGASEVGGSAALLLPKDHDPDCPARLMSAGLALPGVDIEIHDETGTAQPPGDIGEIAVRSVGQMECYIGQPEKTAAAIRDGWVYTGDIGRLDADGFLTILDRTAFAIISNGVTVYPRLVDAYLSEHPAVSIAVTIPLEGQASKSRICAAVILRSGIAVSTGELMRFLAARPDMPIVDHVVIFDQLPQMAGSLKIDRTKVRQALEAALR